jgi:beta-phosphoglucomutase-like phosphatase (HAD superfamily)
MPLHWLAWGAALRAHAAPFEFTIELHHQYAGMSIPEIVRACNARFGCSLEPHSVESAREEYFFAHLDQLVPVEAVVAFARHQHGKKPMAVASGSDRRVVERELDRLGLRALFPVIVTASDVPRSKPFPDMFLRAAGQIGVRPDRCLVFEDGRNGLDAASAAGMAAVYIPTNEPDWVR